MKESTFPQISIMMPAYNAENFITESIQSVLNQTFTDWELLIVNDGSSDRTGEIIASFSDPRIQVFHQTNQGEAVARNHALKQAQGKWLAFLDSDDLFENDFLEKTLSFLQEHPEFGAVYTDGHYINSRGKQLETLSSHRRGPFSGDIFEAVVRASDVFGPPTCTLLNLNNIKEQKIIFDSRIVIGPDWDFLTRFAERNNFGYLDYCGVRYRVHETNITVSTGSKKRRSSLAICRENQTRLSRFHQCSPATREYVFYDLLINLTFDQPLYQKSLVETQQFLQLSKTSRAKLFRLMAGKMIQNQISPDFSKEWLRLSLQINNKDPKTWILFLLVKLSRRLTAWLMKLKQNKQENQWGKTPFNLKP